MDWINKIYVWFNYRWTECVVVERREKKRWNHKSFSFLVSVQHLVIIYDVCLKTRTSDVWVCVCMDVVLCMWIFETTRNRKIQPQQKSNPTKQFMNILSARWQTASINDELCAGFLRVFFQTKWKCVCMISSNFSVNKKSHHHIANQRHGIVTTAAAAAAAIIHTETYRVHTDFDGHYCFPLRLWFNHLVISTQVPKQWYSSLDWIATTIIVSPFLFMATLSCAMTVSSLFYISFCLSLFYMYFGQTEDYKIENHPFLLVVRVCALSNIANQW